MITDELTVYSQLGSPLYGGLVHALHVNAAALDARLAAGRIFGVQSSVPLACVSAHGVDLPPGAWRTLQDWPLDPESVFTLFQQRKWDDRAVRPRQALDELTWSQMRLFQPVEAFAPVVDVLCATFPIHNDAWAMLTLLRCSRQRAYADSHVQALDRLRPALSNLLRSSLEQETRRASAVLTDSSANTAPAPAQAPNELLARLTPTERRILHYLQSGITEREVAQRIHRSPHTVHVHVKNIYRKLGVTSRRELIGVFTGEPLAE